MTRYLCKLLELSVSGYYRWLSAEETCQKRECDDERDAALIKEHFDTLRGRSDALVIKMRLEQLSNVIMNHEKIRRLMKKFNLVATIRKANPYRKIEKTTQEHATCLNLLVRQFDQGEPYMVFLKDITYLNYGNGQTAYLSDVKDGPLMDVRTIIFIQKL
jgi:putative transposase